MTRIATWFRRLLRRERAEAELDKELAYHRERREQELIEEGATPSEARRQVRLEFGGFDQIKEECRDARGTRWVENVVRDLRQGLRGMVQSPGFAAAAILSLALGTGANTAVFQLIDAVRLRPLPIANPNELVEININGGSDGFGNHRNGGELTYPMWEQIRDNQEAFTGVFAWRRGAAGVGQGSDTQVVNASWVSGSAFDVLGVTAYRGRLFTPADDVPGCPNQVVISHRFWQRHFGSSDDAVGSELLVSGVPYTVLGVTEPTFFGIEVGRHHSLTIPFCSYGNQNPELMSARHEFVLRGFARLKPDWTIDRAATYLNTASAGWLAAVAPTDFTATLLERYDTFRLTAEPRSNGVSALRTAYETPLWLLLGITALVLAISCANLANLTLARTLSRGKEIGTRMAIGASRARLVGQLFTESFLLAGIGAAIGVLLAGFLSRALIRFLQTTNPGIELDPSLDWRVVIFQAAVALAACLFFGLLTALYATRARAVASAGSSTRGATTDRGRFSFQRALIAGQVGVSLILVVSALLFLESFRNLFTMDAGFRQNGIVFSALDLGRSGADEEAMPELKRQLLAAVRGIPGVASASTTFQVPLGGGFSTLGVPDPQSGEDRFPAFSWVSPEYFRTMEIPLLAGRDFNEFDRAGAPMVAMVNQAFADRYLHEGDPLGQTFRSLEEPGFPETVYEVVGLVADTLYMDIREEVVPIAYLPDAQMGGGGRNSMIVVTQSSMSATQIADSVNAAIGRVNSGVTSTRTVALRQQVIDGLSRERLLAWLAGFFGAVALLLMSIGLHGVVSYMVARRRREIGIRMALGASALGVIRIIVGQTARWTLAGCILGAVGAFYLARLVQSILFGISPGEPWVFWSAILLLTLIAIFAAWVPTRRAARANPLETLRTE